MAGREYKPVPVRPMWRGRIEGQRAGPQRRGRIGHFHRQMQVSCPRRFRRVDRQRAHGIGHLPIGRGGARQDAVLPRAWWSVGG
jgi:hypothetical protein